MWVELLAALASSLILLFTMPRLAKTSREKILDHPIRERVLDLVRRRPGIRTLDLLREAGYPRGTIRYHAAMLTRSGLIQKIKTDHAPRYVPEDFEPHDVGLLRTIFDGRALDVVERIMVDPGATQTNLTRSLLMTRKVFRRHATQLCANRLVVEEDEHPHKRYYPTAELRRLVGMLRPDLSTPPIEEIPLSLINGRRPL